MNRFSLSSFLPSPFSDEAPRSSLVGQQFEREIRRSARGGASSPTDRPTALPVGAVVTLGEVGIAAASFRPSDAARLARSTEIYARKTVLDPAHPFTGLAVRLVWERGGGEETRAKNIFEARGRTDLDSPRFVAIRDGRDGLESVRTNKRAVAQSVDAHCIGSQFYALLASCDIRERGAKRREVPDLLWSYEYFLNSVGGGVRKIQSALTKSETKEFFFFNLPFLPSSCKHHLLLLFASHFNFNCRVTTNKVQIPRLAGKRIFGAEKSRRPDERNLETSHSSTLSLCLSLSQRKLKEGKRGRDGVRRSDRRDDARMRLRRRDETRIADHLDSAEGAPYFFLPGNFLPFHESDRSERLVACSST